MKAGMDIGEGAKEIAVARNRKWNARATHDGSIQSYEHGEGHTSRNDAGAERTEDDGDRVRSRTLRNRDRIDRQHILHGRVHQDVERSDDCHARDERDGYIALRLPDLFSDHVEIVPSVICPERGDEGGKESGDAAFGADEVSSEVVPRSLRCAKTNGDDAENDRDFENGEDELKFSGFFYAQVIQD